MVNDFYFPAMWLAIGLLSLGLILVSRGVGFFKKKIQGDPFLCAEYDRQLRFLGLAHKFLWLFIAFLVLGGLAAQSLGFYLKNREIAVERQKRWPVYDKQKMWTIPDDYLARTDAEASLIEYGRDLIANTQAYFGENGSVNPGAVNRLNCQSCHLDAGSKPFGNNYFAVFSTYPQQRARSGSLETVAKRINDCFQRSLDGQAIDSTSREMKAMQAYMRWLGTGVPKGEKPKGAGLVELPLLDRPADPQKGQTIYAAKCASCHGADGQGLTIASQVYPPLWGGKSYNQGAGLFRLSRLAGYVKANMPFGATYDNPQINDEEAWDVAAYINAQPRPGHPFLQTDWPKMEKKPFDHPFGPYKDSFPEIQHKFGPFKPIIAYYNAQNKK